MNKYTIYCTEEQTKKALKLGAPIERTHSNPTMWFVYRYPKRFWVSTDDSKLDVGYVVGIPTANQMIGWLEEQGINIAICICADGTYYNFYHKGLMKYYKTHKEATLAAIDAALDYLSKK